MGVTTAIIASAAIGAAGSMASAGISGSMNKGKGGGGVADWTAPQYPWTEPRLQGTSDYISQSIDRIRRGEEAPWMQKYFPQIEKQLKTANRQTYFGMPGNRSESVLGGAAQLGAMTGVGPKATNAYGRKFLQDYSNREAAIDAQLAQMRLSSMEQAAYQYPQLSNQMAAGPQSQPIQYQEPQRPDYIGSAISSIGGALPYLAMGSGGRAASAQTPSGYPGGTYGNTGVPQLNSSNVFGPKTWGNPGPGFGQ